MDIFDVNETNLQPLGQQTFPALESIIRFIGEAPVADEKHQLLEGLRLRIGHGHATVLREQLQMLQVVLLDVCR